MHHSIVLTKVVLLLFCIT